MKLIWSMALLAALGLSGCDKGGAVQSKSAVAQAFGDGVDPASIPSCDAGALKLSDPQEDKASGTITFTVTNAGAAGCGLLGVPVVNLGTVKKPIPIKIMHTPDKIRRVVLAPNTGTASFVLTYLAKGSPCVKPAPMTVILGGQADKAFKVEPAPTMCGDTVHVTPYMGRVAKP